MMAIHSVQPLPSQFFVGLHVSISDPEIEDLLVQAQPSLEDPEQEDELSSLKDDMKIVLRNAATAYVQAETLKRHGNLLTLKQRFDIHRLIADQYQKAFVAAGDSETLQRGLQQFLKNVEAGAAE